MLIAVAFDRPGASARADDLDVLDQARAVSAALRQLGHRAFDLPCTPDLPSLARDLAERKPDLVFNLVESLGGHGRLIHVVPAWLDALRVPYTGAPAEAQFLTSNKVAAKRLLRAGGLPTPDWSTGDDDATTGRTWIVKSVWEHASVGLTDESIFTPRGAGDLADRVRRFAGQTGGGAFAEAFVDGREFNLSLLAGQTPAGGGPSRPVVLPPAEIEFAGYAPGRPRIVGYSAKWDPASFEYSHTPRRFDFPAGDAALVAELAGLARRAWDAFGLRGHARVDFRVDDRGRPWILEVNTNPCLSADAGFAAALARAGMTFTAAVGAIIADARRAGLGAGP